MKRKTDIKYLDKQIKGSYRFLIMAIIFILIGAFFEFLGPRLIGITIDSIIGTQEFDLPPYIITMIDNIGGRTYILEHIAIIIILFIIISILTITCEKIRLYASHILGENIGYEMRKSVFNSLQSATYGYHKNVQTGDIIQRCSTDIDLVRNFVVEFTHLVRIGAKILIAYCFMFQISIQLGFISFLTVPVVSAFSMIFYPKIQKKFTQADEAEGKLQAQVQENLSAPRVVRAFGRQKGELESFEKKNNAFAVLWIKVGHLLSFYWAGSSILAVLQEITVICFGVLFASKGVISTGEVISFIIFNSMLSNPINMIGRIIGNMSKARVALTRVSEIAHCEKETYEGGLPFTFEKEIRFDNVCFAFEDDETKIFNNLSFTIKKGQTVAILGASGTGKTTILSLLTRFYDTTSGNIYIDGVNVLDINLESLRKNIGMVMQEPFLFSKTIRENIALSTQNIDEERLLQAAHTSHIHESIIGFTKGYETLVGERGVTVSGGQKQRLAIARALYTNASILCFDDSLSAVDTVTDRNIRQSLKKNITNMTQIIISQRVNTLMEADNILVIANGSVVEEGIHSDLCNLNGIYSEIVKIQQEVIEKTKVEAGEYNV